MSAAGIRGLVGFARWLRAKHAAGELTRQDLEDLEVRTRVLEQSATELEAHPVSPAFPCKCRDCGRPFASLAALIEHQCAPDRVHLALDHETTRCGKALSAEIRLAATPAEVTC